MKGRTFAGFAVAAILFACGEPLPIYSIHSSLQASFVRTPMTPLVVRLNELTDDQRQDVIPISGTKGVVFNDPKGEYDLNVARINKRARVQGRVTTLTSGVSLLTQRIYYTAGSIARYNLYE